MNRELGFQKMSAEIVLGGMQLPFVVAQAAGAFLAAANVSAIAYSFLTYRCCESPFKVWNYQFKEEISRSHDRRTFFWNNEPFRTPSWVFSC